MTEYPPGVPPESGGGGYPPPPGPGDFSFSPGNFNSPQPDSYGYLPTPPGEFNYSPSGLGAPGANGTNKMAIFSLVASAVGWVCCGIGAVVGPILGVIALGQIKKTNEGGRGLAIAGIAVGGVILAGSILFWVLAFIGAANDDSSSTRTTYHRSRYGMTVSVVAPQPVSPTVAA